jgi:hypothetical protein
MVFFDIPSPLISTVAYGWKYAAQLAELGDNVVGREERSNKAADHNADSYALFGSAAKLLDHPTNPRRVGADGRLTSIT